MPGLVYPLAQPCHGWRAGIHGQEPICACGGIRQSLESCLDSIVAGVGAEGVSADGHACLEFWLWSRVLTGMVSFIPHSPPVPQVSSFFQRRPTRPESLQGALKWSLTRSVLNLLKKKTHTHNRVILGITLTVSHWTNSNQAPLNPLFN